MWISVIVTTLLMTILFSLLLSGAEIERIRAKWPEKRCNIGIMFFASLYKPPEDQRSGTDFSKDNFQFCLSKLADSISVAFMTPFFNILKGQLDALNVFGPIMNFLRTTLATIWGQIATIIREQYMKYTAVFVLFTKGYKHLEFAAGRINAIVTALLYGGLSLSVGLQNLFDFVVKVVLIMIGILAIMVILLFFFLLPTIPLILVVITALVAAGFTAAASSTGAFCIDPDALIRRADGTWVPLHTVRVGDLLWTETETENRVTGVLRADSSQTPLVSIHGVRMSDSHRVKDADQWLLARDHPDQTPTKDRLPEVICLNTTQHAMWIRAPESSTPICVSDWEEVSDEAGRRAWTDFVRGKLFSVSHRYPNEVPLLSPEARVYHEQKGWIRLADVQMGDRISTFEVKDLYDTGDVYFTTVTGLYEGEARVDTDISSRTPWKSEGVWTYETFEEGLWWDLPAPVSPSDTVQRGRMLITDAETFLVQRGLRIECVRDFTEVGAKNLEAAYGFLEAHMNNRL